MPNDIYGVKFDFGGARTTYTIVTDRAPVYGVFYVKGGKDKGVDVVAWSNALDCADYRFNPSLTAADFVVRPDGAFPVPVPGTGWLFGSGLVGIVAARRWRPCRRASFQGPNRAHPKKK